MTLAIELTDEEEARLAKLAGNTPLSEFVHETLRDLANCPKNGADALAYWKREGITGIFQDRADSPEFASELRRAAETREHEV